MKIHYQNLDMLHLLWVIPVLIALYVFAHQQRMKHLKIFADIGLLSKINISIAYNKRLYKHVLIIIACFFIAFALTRPGWNPKAKSLQREGRDVVFILDVSKSMLAQDLAPNRLEHAKIAIMDCIETLKGDRVALVVFAGTAAVKCPLTLDYGFFRMMLKSVSVKSISRGGTLIGDAIRCAKDQIFNDKIKRFKDIILITDGEDHDSFPVEAAKEAGKQGIRIIAIGLGDEIHGSLIVVKDQYGNKKILKYQGKEVRTKLDVDTLTKMVNATGGQYFNVATGTINLGEVYLDLIASAEKKKVKSETIKRYEEKFQIFLAIALFLICAEIFISERKRR